MDEGSMFIVTAAQMKKAEDAANALGHSYEAMMELAGQAVAEAIAAEFDPAGRHVAVLVGPGNNGGDGLVAARHLADLGATVSLYIWRRTNLEQDPNWLRLEPYQLPAFFYAADEAGQRLAQLLEQSAIVVDALLGTGVSRPIRGDLAALLTQAGTIIEHRRAGELPTLLDPLDPADPTEGGPAIVAVDIASGLYSDTGAVDPLTLPADLTVTFAAPKRGHVLFPGAAYVGQLVIADIGIAVDEPAGPQLATWPLIASLLPDRPLFGHKGTFGKALLVAGCSFYTGAPALSGRAAYRVGAGLVTLAVPEPIQAMVATNLTEATYLPLPHQAGAIDPAAVQPVLAQLGGYSAMLVGPGLSQAEPTGQFLDHLLAGLAEQDAPPLIFDADALNILAQRPAWWTRLPPDSVLTPHPGEMSRLTGLSIAELEAGRLEVVSEMAQTWRQTVVFKGAFTVVAASSGAVMVMPFANPALATAGSGDVLAGCIAGLLAQGLSPFEAAVVGAYLHGLAGELARDRLWQAGVMAGDLAELIPVAMREIALSG